MKIARFLFAILAIAALSVGSVGCSDLPTESGGCPAQSGPHCLPDGG